MRKAICSAATCFLIHSNKRELFSGAVFNEIQDFGIVVDKASRIVELMPISDRLGLCTSRILKNAHLTTDDEPFVLPSRCLN